MFAASSKRNCDTPATTPCRSGHEISSRTGPCSAAPEVIGIGRQLLRSVVRDQEVVLEAEAAAAVPVDARLDREHHPRVDCAAACLVGVRRLMRTGPDAVGDRMRRLARVAGFCETVANEPVELG